MSRSSSADLSVTRVLRWLPGLLLLALMLAHASGAWPLAPLQRFDAWLHDVRLNVFARKTPDERLAVITVDERSLASLGRWPWSRDHVARLVDALFVREGASLVGLDLILAEADRSSGLHVLDELAAGPLAGNAPYLAALEARRSMLDHDSRLVGVLRAHKVVLGFHLSNGAAAVRSGALPKPLAPPGLFNDLHTYPGFGGNLPAFQEAALSGGFLNARVDSDGVRRTAELLAQSEGQVHPTMALALARARLGNPPLVLRNDPASTGHGPRDLQIAGLPKPIPLGQAAQVVLPYAAKSGLPLSFSAVDVLEGRIPKAVLQGRIVLIGATAPALADLHATPVAEQLPGVYAHAGLLTALLDGTVPVRPGWASAAEVGALVLLFAILATMWSMGLQAALPLALIGITALVLGNFAAWSQAHWALPLASLLVMAFGLFAWRLFFGHYIETRARRRLATLFGQYVPPELVSQMSRDPGNYDMEGRSAELTVLFADIRGFTSLSETMTPGELAALINEFLSEITDIVRAHGGTLDKYVGDAVMAFWGAPVPDAAHARHAVEAARAMLQALPALNRRFAVNGWPPLTLGIGVNTGTMVVGDLGSRHRRAYTVLGDAVNVASRMQVLSGKYGVSLAIGQATRDAIPDWPCRLLGTVAVRGRKAPVTLFEPLPLQGGQGDAPGRATPAES